MTGYLTRKGIRFVAIVVAGVVAALLLWLATNVFNVPLPGVDPSRLDVQLFVAPQAFDWVSEAAERFNAEGRRFNRRPIVIHVVERDGLSLRAQVSSASLNPAPTAWIAEGAFTLDLVNLAARQSGISNAFTAEGSVAQSVMMWGGFADRIAALDSNFGGLTWKALHEAAMARRGWSSLGGQPEWGFFKLVLADPSKSSEALAALLAAAAEYHGKTSLTAADVNDARFQQWAQELVDAVPNFANLGSEPGKALAVRGASAGDAGQLLEADWLSAAEGMGNWQTPAFRYAPTAVIFDFPFAVWSGPPGAGGDPSAAPSPSLRSGSGLRLSADAAEDSSRQDAARLFRDYLLQDAQQRRAEAFGLRPASGNVSNAEGSLFARWASLGFESGRPPTASAQASADAVLAALRWAERAAGR